MASIRESAESYEMKTVRHIEELECISVDVEVISKTYGNAEKSFTIDVIEQDGEDYRLPASVLIGLKSLLSEIPDIKFFKVIKTGTTMEDTAYEVVPTFD